MVIYQNAFISTHDSENDVIRDTRPLAVSKDELNGLETDLTLRHPSCVQLKNHGLGFKAHVAIIESIANRDFDGVVLIFIGCLWKLTFVDVITLIVSEVNDQWWARRTRFELGINVLVFGIFLLLVRVKRNILLDQEVERWRWWLRIYDQLDRQRLAFITSRIHCLDFEGDVTRRVHCNIIREKLGSYQAVEYGPAASNWDAGTKIPTYFLD